MKIEQHKLVGTDSAAVPFQASPNVGGALEAPSVLVIHYTAGRSAESAVRTLTSPTTKAAAHLVIGRTGSIAQLVPFNRVAWHAGESLWNGRPKLNGWSIGIELDNPGFLRRTGSVWRTSFHATVDDDDVLVARHKHGGPELGWHIYPQPQLEALEAVALALFEAYPSLVEVVGHEDIAPHRKRDPGPAFPMAHFQSLLTGRKDDGPAEQAASYVAMTGLNLRSGPTVESAKVLDSALPKGTRMEVLGRSGMWCKVLVQDAIDGDAGHSGWVSGKHLEKLG